MTIVVVEDEPSKLDRIKQVISGSKELRESTVATADSMMDALHILKDTKADALILDIAIPIRSGGVPQEMGGVELLEELFRHKSEYQMPSNVIGITAYKEVYDRAGSQFESRMLSLVMYSHDSTAWERALEGRLFLIAASENSPEQFQSDLGVVCAVESPELDAILDLDWHWEPRQLPGDHTPYYVGTYQNGGVNRKVVAACSSRMGMPAAISLATKIIAGFRPRYLAIAGIAAGVRSRCEYGDVIAANPCWDWGSGKWTMDGTDIKFAPAPFQAQLEPQLRDQIRLLANDEEALMSIATAWRADRPSAQFRIRLGGMASGAAVLADGQTVARILEHNRELLAVEMEAYGVFVAAREASEPRPLPFALKSVVDYGDALKDDRFQSYGAYTSAAVLRILAERHL